MFSPRPSKLRFQSKKNGGLGLRDICQPSNVRLKRDGGYLPIPIYLLQEFWKAKYYPLTTFMEVAQRGGRSYIWQSLLASKTVLESGSIWQVGSGDEICIYSTFCLYSHIRVLNEDARVFNRFFLEVAYLILSIPLPCSHGIDKRMRDFGNNGCFKMLSAYPSAFALHHEEIMCESLRGRNRKEVWVAAWGANIPRKVKHLPRVLAY